MPDLKNKVPDLGTKVTDPKLDVPDLRSGGIRLNLTAAPLTNGCHSDNMIQLGPLRSQLLFQFVQITDAYFSYLFLQGGINSGVSVFKNAMVALCGMSILSFSSFTR